MPFLPPITRRQFLQITLAAPSLALSGCGWTLAEVRPTANVKENQKELAIYSWAGYYDPQLLEAFKTQTGIQVLAEPFTSNEMMLATFQAGKGAIYSIIYPSDYKVSEMIKHKFLSRLDHSRLSGLKELLPQFQDSVYDRGNRYSVPISWGTTGLLFNTDELPPPQDWNYLWQHQPQLNRKMALLDDTREVMGAALKSLGHSYNSTKPREIKQAYEKLLKLKPAVTTFTTDAWKDRLLAGDLLLAMVYSTDAVRLIQENPDSKLAYVIPKSGTSLWSDTMVIPRTAPNPDAAYAWMNFMLQPAIAADLTERLFFATPNRGAMNQLPTFLRNNHNLFPPDEVLQRCERIQPLSSKITELYDQYWTKLTSA